MANSQVVIAASCIDKERLGYQACSLTHPADNSAPAIAAGGKVEIAGALYDITADETIVDGGIANSSQVYFLLTVSGASFTAAMTITAPTWDQNKQGFYTGINRAIGGCYKDSGGNYVSKWLYEDKQINSFIRYLDGTIQITNAQLAANAVSAGKINWTFSSGGPINPGAAWALAAGLYILWSANAYTVIQVYINGGWRSLPGNLNTPQVVFSDGTNMQLHATQTDAVYYVKLA